MISDSDTHSPPLDISNFVGIWQRTAIYEPRETLGPEADQKKMVIWIQSKHGAFIDIRFDPGQPYDPLLLKSFAGFASFDNSSMHLTWHREIDYRIMVSGAGFKKGSHTSGENDSLRLKSLYLYLMDIVI